MNQPLRFFLNLTLVAGAAAFLPARTAAGGAPAQAAVPAQAEAAPPVFANNRLVLEPAQSRGGKRLVGKTGDVIGVFLDRSCETNFEKPERAGIDWNLAGPVPAGWWRGTVEGPPQYGTRDFGIQFMTPQKGSVIVGPNYTGWGKTEAVPFEFWLYTAEPASCIRIQPVSTIWRYNATWPVTRIVLEHTPPAGLTAADAVTLELSVRPDGSVPLPLSGLPPGNWSVTGKTAAGGTVIIGDAAKRNLHLGYAPGRYKRRGLKTAYFFSDVPIEKIGVPTPGLFSAILLRHNAALPGRDFASPDPLTPTVDTARMETARLELSGTALAGNAPVFPLLPRGLKTAVLTSWDDGKPEDLRCAQILNRYGYHPSFFLNHDSPAMKFLDQLEALNVEIGSHCYTHPSLHAQPPRRGLDECQEMRRILEKALGHPVISFAYPNGYFPAWDAEGDYVLRAVKAAGYWSGRTTATQPGTVETTGDLCTMKTDGFFGNARDLERSWKETRAKDGGIFYFWGHSWQIGKTEEQWKKFETFAAQFARQSDAWYPSQGELALWLWARRNVQVTVVDQRPDRMLVELRRPWLHPWLAARCPLSLKVPAGVTRARWQDREIPVSDGFIEWTWTQAGDDRQRPPQK